MFPLLVVALFIGVDSETKAGYPLWGPLIYPGLVVVDTLTID